MNKEEMNYNDSLKESARSYEEVIRLLHIAQNTNKLHVLVTGPARSGTTIMAQAIARSIDGTYIDESDFGVSDLKKFESIICAHLDDELKPADNIVLQGPGITHHLLNILKRFPFIIIVYVYRDSEAILASQNKRFWIEHNQRYEYGQFASANPSNPIFDFMRVHEIPILHYKAYYWMQLRKNTSHLLLTCDYHSLADTDLWVKEADRVDEHGNMWGLRQWKKY